MLEVPSNQNNGVSLEYIGIYLLKEDSFVKLLDHSSPSFTIHDSQVKKDLIAVKDGIRDDEYEVRTYNGSQDWPAYIFQHSDVFFYLLLSLEPGRGTANLKKLQSLFADLKKDLTGYARGDLETL